MWRARHVRRTDRVTFRDRIHAGRALGERLRGDRLGDPVVLGLPRGGVAVAAGVAEALAAPLDIIVARKLGVPWPPALAFGAGAPGVVALPDDVIGAAGWRRPELYSAAARGPDKLADLQR